MTSKLKQAFDREMACMSAAYIVGDFPVSVYHLERAHILGQRSFAPHLKTHWWMLRIGILRHDSREILGQAFRLFAVFPGSVFGWVPVGNTGGANVSALKPMPIPDDLRTLFED